MLSVKNELLQALAAALDKLYPGAGSKAAFKSPKVAAHGDLAVTAAMQLLKPLKADPDAASAWGLRPNRCKNSIRKLWVSTWLPRCKISLLLRPGLMRWRSPGRALSTSHKPAAKQQVVLQVFSAPSSVADPPMAKVCWLNLFRPTPPPAACGPRASGRAGRCGVQSVCVAGLAGAP